MEPIDFVRDFIKYYEKTGIFDEYDKDSNKMKTSAGVEALYKQAKACMPPELTAKQAANAMRDLDPAMRDALIAKDENRRVIDLRTEFARRMAENSGARGILQQLVEAVEAGDSEKIKFLFLDAKGIVEGPENVIRDS